MSADKNDVKDCKPDYSLIPKSLMDALSYCLMAGAIKYGRDNYKKGHESNTLTSAAGRHLKQIEEGEMFDKDTTDRLIAEYGDQAPQIYHWANVAASACMAIEQITLGTHRGLDREPDQLTLSEKYGISGRPILRVEKPSPSHNYVKISGGNDLARAFLVHNLTMKRFEYREVEVDYGC